MNQILLSQFHEEVRIEFDIEVDISSSILGLRDMEIECLIQESYALVSVCLLPPLDDCLEEHVLGRLPHGIANLTQELQLLFGVFQHFLLYAAVNHSVEGSHVGLIVASCFLVNCVSTRVVSLQCFLVANFSMETRVFRLQLESQI